MGGNRSARHVWTMPAGRHRIAARPAGPGRPAVHLVEEPAAVPHEPERRAAAQGEGDINGRGFCSTFRDWTAEAPGNNFPREVCEHALAPSLPDRVEAAYQRDELFGKSIALVQAWGLLRGQAGAA